VIERGASGTESDTVTAEGQGSSEKLAIESAIRQAVRQVIGVLIDSQTLIKNDELIEDKIIAYSHGYIDSWEKISASDSEGIYSVKIKAVVQRREIQLKLKEHRVEVTTSFDGEKFFDASQNKLAIKTNRKQTREKANELLQQALKDLPKLLRVEVQKPHAGDYNPDLEQLQLRLKLSVDAKQYEIVQKRLVNVLEEVALAKTTEVTTLSDFQGDPREDECVIRFTCYSEGNPAGRQSLFLNQQLSEDYRQSLVDFGIDSPWVYKIPNTNFLYHLDSIRRSELQDQDQDPETWCLWVCAATNLNRAGLRWQGYLVDADVDPVLAAVQTVGVVAKDKEGQLVTEISCPISVNRWELSPPPLLPRAEQLGLNKDGEQFGFSSRRLFLPVSLITFRNHDEDGFLQTWQYNVFVSPFFVGELPVPIKKYPAGNIQVFPAVNVAVEFPFELERLKDVTSFTATITHHQQETP
jgi:hypothetical protein